MSDKLNPDKALIFRIVHRDNVPWILQNGMHSRNSGYQDPNYRTIGNPELIERREHWLVPIPPGGTLSDYVPFYFTPYSPMMLNIVTGRGVPRVPKEEIVIFVSSLRKVAELGIPYVFTDRHAKLKAAIFYSDLADLVNIDWALLQARDFEHDPDDPEKGARYQAEALIHEQVPMAGFMGLICYTGAVKSSLDQMVSQLGLTLTVHKRPGLYF